MKAVILVGGLGTRLRPLTSTLPKPMLPMLNRPFIEHVLGNLARHGVTSVILSTGYLPTVFADHISRMRDDGLAIELVEEDHPLGTCGAVKNVADRLDDTFMVLNGDILSDLNITHMIDYHRKKQAVATIALTAVEDPTSYGLVPLRNDGRVEMFVEKPSWDEVTTDLINAGTYILEPEVLRAVPAGETYSFERGLFPHLLEDGRPVFGFPSSSYWLDIGTPKKFIQAHQDMLEGKLPIELPGEEIKSRVWAGEGSDIDAEAVLYGPILLGKNCTIKSHAVVIGPTSIGDGCIIEKGARVEGSVLLDGCRLAESAVVKTSIIGKEASIGRKVHVDEVSVLGDRLDIGEDNWLRRGIRVSPDTKIPPGTIKF